MKRTKQQKIFYYTHHKIYSKKLNELHTTEEKVIKLLKENPHYRNCDKCLIMAFWFLVDGYNMQLDARTIHKLTPAETITRCRRYIQNDLFLFLPTDDEVKERREISQEAVREWSKHEVCKDD
jgi:hypothetical protein